MFSEISKLNEEEKRMFQKSLIKILEATKGKSIIIVSAGLHGKELAGALIDRDREVRCFFDNKEGLIFSGYPLKSHLMQIVMMSVM